MGLGLIVVVASLASLACWIIVLTKLFPDKGIGWGIFGVICGIYTFIWGWQNVERHDLKNVMLIWTGAFVANVLLRVVGSSMR